MRSLSYLFLLLTGLSTGCNKLTDVDGPPGRLDNPFQSDATASSFLLGIYEKNMERQTLYNGHMSRYGGLQGGELTHRLTVGDDADFQHMRLKPNNRALPAFWTPAYESIARCNLVLQDLPAAKGISASLKPALLGEAHFLRALSYFYLVNLFDSIPFVIGVDIGENSQLPQVAPGNICDNIVADLEAALPLLPERHPDTGLDSLRHTRVELGAARALLARSHLFRGNYQQAAHYAGLVIEQGGYQLETLANTFRYQSKETILQFKPVVANANTAEGLLFLQDVGGTPNYGLTPAIAQSFAPGDLRKTQWTKLLQTGNPDKYQVRKYTIAAAQPRLEYNIVLRLAEQYLIRAEARARLGDLGGAIADLAAVRQRAGLTPPPANSAAVDLLRVVALERQAELFAEWGHRLLDLHRWWALPTGDVLQHFADSVLRSQPGWLPFMRHWPIPQQELMKNPHLRQNAGYN